MDGLVAIDRIDEADAQAAARLFTLYNALKQGGGRLLAASRTPLATLALREDVRTRLGWGVVHELWPLADEDTAAALSHLCGPSWLPPSGGGHRLSFAAQPPRHALAAGDLG